MHKITRPSAAAVLALVLALSGCQGNALTLGRSLQPGVYRLASLRGEALPARGPCGVYNVVSGRLLLGEDGSAEHTLRYAELGTGREITFLGTGRHRSVGNEVILDLQGKWSHAPGPETLEVRLRRTGEGLVRTVGMECDAGDEELYRP